MADLNEDAGPRTLNETEKKNLTWKITKKCLKFAVSLINDILDAFWPDEPRKITIPDKKSGSGSSAPNSDPSKSNSL